LAWFQETLKHDLPDTEIIIPVPGDILALD
jgi:hypothetical protein